MIKHLIILSFLFLLINCDDKISMVYLPEEPTFPDSDFQTLAFKLFPKAFKYFEDAVDGAYAVTVPHIYIAVMYVLGHGVTKDVERAKGILNNLATSGHKKAKFLYNFILYASPENSDQVREAAGQVIKAHKNDSDLQAARPLIEGFLKNN